jgi:hypothetical protein
MTLTWYGIHVTIKARRIALNVFAALSFSRSEWPLDFALDAILDIPLQLEAILSLDFCLSSFLRF